MYNYMEIEEDYPMLDKAFKIVCDTVEQAIQAQNFQKVNVDNVNDNELVSLYTGENLAYSVVYYKDKMHMVLRQSTMTEEGPDNDWKVLATWMFDPSSDTEKEAQGIANDFAEMLSAPVAIKRQKQTKKKAKKDEGNADPLFFAKRCVNIFPELKDEIKQEEDSYYPFRGATFAKDHIVPKVNALVKKGNKKELDKLMQLLSNQYSNGNLDTRSIVTMVVLNGIDPQYDEKISEFMSPELKKAFKSSVKYRNREVKPERVKKQRKVIGTRL